MSFCTFDSTAGMYDSTPIENMFLAEYLPTAPDVYLRVYLYLRMTLVHPEMGDTVDEVCRVLRIERDSFDNAMTYWERQGLIQRTQDNPPAWSFLPVMRGAPSAMDSDYYKYRDFNQSLQAIFGGDNLLHPKEYETAHDWLNVFGFTQDAVLLAVRTQRKHTKAKKPNLNAFFKKLNEKMLSYAERGLTTVDKLRPALEFDDSVYALAEKLIARFSMNRAATEDELALVKKWLEEWKYAEKDVLDACAETIKATRPSFGYLDTVLKKRLDVERTRDFPALQKVLRELGDNVLPTEDMQGVYRAWIEAGFEPETILLAARQCARRRRHSFDALSRLIDDWRGNGIFAFDAAEAYLSRMNQSRDKVHALLLRAGKDRSVQMGDIRMYEEWRETWADDVLAFAADCAKDMQLPMRYMDKLLKGWRAAGVKTLSDAKAQRENHAEKGTAAQNPALNYQQRPASEIDLSGYFLNLTDDDTEGDAT